MKDPKSSQSGDQATQGGTPVKFLAVTFPPDNSTTGESNVFVMMPTLDKGILCLAKGDVTVPPGSTLDAVYLKVVTPPPIGPPLPSDDDVRNSYDRISANASWNFNGQLQAKAGPGSTLVNNTLCVVARTGKYVIVGGQPTIVFTNDRQNVPFKGKQVSSCPAPPTVAQASTASAAPVAPSVPVVDPSRRHPTDRDGDWLLYRGLSAALPGMGSVLLLDGQPLRARVAAFAVENVLWRHSLEILGTVWRSGVVRRVVGDLVPADNTFSCSGAPKYSLVVSQVTNSIPVKPFVHVLASECRERPDFVHLDPTQEIRVQVNFDTVENVRAGEFDLWVKVVTA